MGQRANYIFKDENDITIHYNHWRANSILSDLYLGEKKFIEFVKECIIYDEILDENWIEGCVIIDKHNKELFFWSFEITTYTSLLEYYLKQLSKKWDGWNIQILENKMYDVERILKIDYLSNQKKFLLEINSNEKVENDKLDDEWVATLVVLKDGETLSVKKTQGIYIENIISFGQGIIPMLKNKENYTLPKEGNDDSSDCVIIDLENKKVFFNDSILGLIETSKELWSDYELIMGDVGYIKLLERANIDTTGIRLSEERVNQMFFEMIQCNTSFDPMETAKTIMKDYENVEFNPNFFDNMKPKISFLDRLKFKIFKLFN